MDSARNCRSKILYLYLFDRSLFSYLFLRSISVFLFLSAQIRARVLCRQFYVSLNVITIARSRASLPSRSLSDQRALQHRDAVSAPLLI